jgi:hypothetical protein
VNTLAILVASSGFGLFACGNASAHGDHKSTHGGDVGRGNDEIVIEFVMEKGTLNLYVDDEQGKPMDTDKVTGTLTLLSPQRPAQEVKLEQAGPHRLSAPGIKPAPGERMRAHIKFPGGEEFESVALFSDHKPGKHGAAASAGASAPAAGAAAAKGKSR